MFPNCDHSQVVEFKYHNRGHRNTTLCPSNVFKCTTIYPMSLVPDCFRLPPLIFPFTLPFPVRCRRCRGHPGACQVHSLLISPFSSNPCRIPLHRLLAEVQNRPRCNVLCNRIMPLQDICSHLFKPRLLHRCLQRQVLPASIHPLLWLPPRNPPGDPVLETSQVPSHAAGRHPSLRPKQKNRMYHRLEEHPQNP